MTGLFPSKKQLTSMAEKKHTVWVKVDWAAGNRAVDVVEDLDRNIEPVDKRD